MNNKFLFPTDTEARAYANLMGLTITGSTSTDTFDAQSYDFIDGAASLSADECPGFVAAAEDGTENILLYWEPSDWTYTVTFNGKKIGESHSLINARSILKNAVNDSEESGIFEITSNEEEVTDKIKLDEDLNEEKLI